MAASIQFSSAISDFRRARNQANLKEIIARFTGESTQLLDYEEVRQLLKASASSERGLREIPLEAIVGSVNRYTDFNRDFLPLQDSDKQRWARVKMAVDDLSGLPPIEVYQIGEVYFVKDGNHRVSVARQMEATHIQAYVTEIRSRVKLTPEIQPDDLIIKAEYVDFLEHTQLDELRPEADLDVTAAGQYPILEEYINVHRWYMGIEQQREISFREAVAHWFDHVYLPVIQTIRERGILRYFPGRTETDLYLWIARHKAELEQFTGWQVKTDNALADLIQAYGLPDSNLFTRIGTRLLNLVTPSTFAGEPPTGTWRKQTLALRREDCLFRDILVTITGHASGWDAFEQAVAIARHEGGRLHGLHVTHSGGDLESPEAQSIQADFESRCQEAGIEGELSITRGDIATEICQRSRWVDLVVTALNFPPPENPVARLDYGIREIIQRCPRPVLAVPRASLPIRKALLMYDGSPKAEEALFIATHLAAHWGLDLHVLTVFEEDSLPPETLLRAKTYLEDHQVEANYIAEQGMEAKSSLEIAAEIQPDLIIMGGYGFSPVLEVVLGSLVDLILRAQAYPVLICR